MRSMAKSYVISWSMTMPKILIRSIVADDHSEHFLEQDYWLRCVEADPTLLTRYEVCDPQAIGYKPRCSTCGNITALDGLDFWGRCRDCAVVCTRCGASIQSGMRVAVNALLDEYITYCYTCAANVDVRMCRWCRRNFDAVRAPLQNCECGNQFCVVCIPEERHDCRMRLERIKTLHAYEYKPKPLFSLMADDPQGTKRFFGVEWEVDSGRMSPLSPDEQKRLLELSNKQSLFYLKRDGSIPNGVEVVTHPGTRRFHRAQFPWKAVIERAKDMALDNESPHSNAGLHIHVSRDAFGEGLDPNDPEYAAKVEARMGAVVYLYDKLWPPLYVFSRRSGDNIKFSKPFERGEVDGCRTAREFYKRAYTLSYNYGHAYCVNVAPKNTIEFRCFKGTSRPEIIQASLSLVDAIIDTARETSDEKLAVLKWRDITDRVADEDFKVYLAERKL